MHFPGSPPIICLAIFVFAIQLCVCKNSTIADDTSKHTFEVGNSVENGEKKKALHTIRKVLENYSDNAIRQILGSTTIIPAHGDELRETTPEDFISTTPPVSPKTITSSKFHDPEKLVNEEEPSSNIKPKAGIMRIRADIRQGLLTNHEAIYCIAAGAFKVCTRLRSLFTQRNLFYHMI